MSLLLLFSSSGGGGPTAGTTTGSTSLLITGSAVGVVKLEKNTSLYMYGWDRYTKSLNLSINGGGTFTNGWMDLFIQNSYVAISDDIPLFIKAPGVNAGYVPFSNSLNLFINRGPHIGDAITLYIESKPPVTGNIDLYIKSMNVQTGNIDLVLPSTKDLPTGKITLYTHGF